MPSICSVPSTPDGPTGYLKAAWPKVPGPVFGRFSDKLGPQSPSRSMGLVLQCRLHHKSAPQTNSRDAKKIRPDCLQVPSPTSGPSQVSQNLHVSGGPAVASLCKRGVFARAPTQSPTVLYGPGEGGSHGHTQPFSLKREVAALVLHPSPSTLSPCVSWSTSRPVSAGTRSVPSSGRSSATNTVFGDD
jgi:hypothetical protein